MLEIFREFREKIDKVMLRCINRRVILYGYSRGGQFLEWYGEYYHSITPDYIITEDWASGSMLYKFPIFRESLFDFDYKDVKDAVVWLTADDTEGEKAKLLESHGYVKNESYFDFNALIYGEDLIKHDAGKGVFAAKTGKRNVQFMEYAEYVYGCDFVEAVYRQEFLNSLNGAHSYCITTQKEIFPILDKLHCHPGEGDGIFDFGCGKGGAMLTFLDYGFKKVGGVEYEDGLYEVLAGNYQKLSLLNSEEYGISLIHGDAAAVNEELDQYNYFYYFDPFEDNIYYPTIMHICESLKRAPRKVHLICINPRYNDFILKTGRFHLVNSFVTTTKQKICNIYESKDF